MFILRLWRFTIARQHPRGVLKKHYIVNEKSIVMLESRTIYVIKRRDMLAISQHNAILLLLNNALGLGSI